LVVDLKRLEHLVALVEEGHFGRAAERVHLSQPAFSRSIQSIESDLGLRLFDRGVEGAKPTPAGGFLIERARRLLFDARCLQRDASLYRDSELGDTAFGAGPFPAAALLPLVVPSLRQRYPGVALRLEIGNWPLLQQRLLVEDIEFFIADGRDIPADPRIEVTPLGRLPGHLYVRAGHPLAGRACRLADAAVFGIAATKLPSAVEELFGRLSGSADGSIGLVLQCDDTSLLRTLATQTDTVIGLPDAWVQGGAGADALVQLQVDDLPAVYSDTRVVSLLNRTSSPMARLVIDCVREVAARIGMRPEP
jgi:DNA-binding transcriptional LysR family regulator